MITYIYNEKDTTLYERYPNLNTGIDEVLEINKEKVNSSYYNSRVLVKFDLSELTNNYSNTILSNARYYLRLYATEPQEIPVDYTLYAHAVSQSWNMGSGRFAIIPTQSNGVSWNYRLNSATTSSAWLSGSYAAGSTGSYVTNPGGGNWYTAYTATQSFSYTTSDVAMDVTSLVLPWLNITIPKNGFIIKKESTDESSSDIFSSLKFFSKDTHTIYQPKLELRYDDSVFHTSYSLVDFSDEISLVITNLQPQYAETDVARVNVFARPKYPPRTFATSSNYLTQYQLASSSYYSVVDAQSNEIVIPFDETYTKVSADSKGSFFKLHMRGFQPERYYKIIVKTKPNSTDQYVLDRNWIFKVTK
jgi:hypothetical protein